MASLFTQREQSILNMEDDHVRHVEKQVVIHKM
jgi:hypothetical protein